MVGVGSRNETESESGISHFVEHMVFKGGKRFPTARDVSEAIEGVGGVLNAATDRESDDLLDAGPHGQARTGRAGARRYASQPRARRS